MGRREVLMSVLIKGGRIVTAADDYVADIYVEDETVTLIGESLDQRFVRGQLDVGHYVRHRQVVASADADERHDVVAA